MQLNTLNIMNANQQGRSPLFLAFGESIPFWRSLPDPPFLGLILEIGLLTCLSSWRPSPESQQHHQSSADLPG
jgi:hypothetical protein